MPRAGHEMRVVVGQPVPLADLQAKCAACRNEAERRLLWAAITERVDAALHELEARNPPQPAAAQQPPTAPGAAQSSN